MASLIKTYITDAPWRSILLFGLLFAFLSGGLHLFLRYRTTGEYSSGAWYGDLALWFLAGMFTKYVTWRATGYLERKNEQWRANR
ncbi:MAG: hypothetical protein ACJATN_001294 [Neolewinella sp.]|jgi:hypothetical protein